MRHLILTAVVIATVALIGGCSSSNVSYDSDPAADFAKLKTFNWMEVTDDAAAYGMKKELGDQVENAVDKQLQAKGMTKVAENPDVLMIYHVTKEQKIDTNSWGYKYDPNWGKGDDVQTYAYAVGTLVVDMVDAESKHLLWRGTGDKILPEDTAPEKRTQIIDEIVVKIFKDFPPKK
jgi:hypothetical protein